MFKRLLIINGVFMLFACGGEQAQDPPVTSSTSSSASSSSSGSPTLDMDFGGDLPRGRTLWAQKKCDTCHGSGPGQGDVWPLDTKKLVRTNVNDLADYIDKEMPRTYGAETCQGQCAKDTAQVMIDWVNNPQDYIPKQASSIETAACEDEATIDLPSLTRLSPIEYRRSLRDLFKLDNLPDGSLLPDDEIDNSFLYSDSIVDSHAEAYQKIGETVAAAVLTKLENLAGCNVSGNTASDRQCAERYLKDLAERAFRGPVNSELMAVILDAYRDAESDTNTKEGLMVGIDAILQSPFFLYRSQGAIGLDASSSHLDQFINATRMSYLIAGTIPDDALWADAKAGQLTQTKLMSHAQRILQRQDTRDYLSVEFVARWLKVNRLASHRDIPEERLNIRRQGAFNFIKETAWGPNGGLEPLLTAKLLGRHTGGTEDHPDMIGIMTQPAWMTMFASDMRTQPIARGVFIAENLLCREVPGFDGVVEFPEPIPGLSLRDRLEQHRKDPLCASCHALFDPFGLALENYDLNGNWRDKDDGAQVKASGVYKTNTGEVTFANAAELFQTIAQSDEIKRCAAKQWYAYAHRIKRPHALSCDKNPVVDAFGQGGLEQMILSTLQGADFFKGVK